MLLQVHFEVQSTAGLVVAIVGFLAIAIPLVFLIWNRIVNPLREGWYKRNSSVKRLAFNEFTIQWLLDHSLRPIFILDEKKRCIFANDTLLEVLKVDSSDVLGRGWHKLVKESDLTRVIQKWEEAYTHQSPYTNVSALMVGRAEKRFLVTAEPFIWKGRVTRYLGTFEAFDVIEESSR